MAEDLGAEGGLQGPGVDRHLVPLVPDADEGDEDPQPQRGVAVEEVVGEDGDGLVGADSLEHGRDRAPRGGGGPRGPRGPARQAPGPRRPRRRGRRRPRRRATARRAGPGGLHERSRPVPRHRPDRGARHLLVLVRDQPAKRVRERQGLPLCETGRLEARPSPVRARLGDHRLEERQRRLQPLFAEPGQHRHHRRPDREVGVVPQVPQAGEGIHVGVAREVEERFRPHLEVRVAEQRLGLWHDRAVAGLVQDREGATAHLRVAVAEETAHRGVGGRRLTAHRHEVEGVEDLPGFHRPEAGGQHLRGLPVEDHRRGALGVEAVLPQALAQRGHVAPVHPGRQQEPQADERQDHEHEADRAYPPERREERAR